MTKEEANEYIARTGEGWHFQMTRKEYVAVFRETRPLRYG